MHELKSGLSRYIAHARTGNPIEITSHNEPVARIVGIPPTDQGGVSRLLVRGAAHWGGGKPSPLPPVVLGSRGKLLGEMVLEDRG